MFSSIYRFSRLVKFVPNARNFCPKRCGFKPFLYVDKNVLNARTITRSLWFLCDNRTPTNPLCSVSVAHSWTSKCTCGCNLHTKGEQELAAFLDEEINNERKAQKTFKVPALDKFESKLDGSEIVLTRKFHNEVITVKLNINHSADSEGTVLDETEDKSKAISEIRSKPNFTVEIEKNGKILSFHCCYSEAVLEDFADTYNDVFHITELAFYEDDWKDSVYSVCTDIMNGNLYDLLTDLLEERGISNDFAHQLIEFCTSHEHKLYIGLLEKMKKFISEK